MNRKFLASAVLVFGAFALWTFAVHNGITHGSRHSMWQVHEFGSWPQRIDQLDGTSNIELSIYAPIEASPGDRTADVNIIGRADIGTDVDQGDSDNINGSRFVAPMRAGAITEIAAYVAGPVDAAPRDQFQIAVYGDRDGAPADLLAVSEIGRLTTDAWNWAPIRAELEPGHAYWLVYNSNGRTADVNNITLRHVTGNPVDMVLQSHGTGATSSIADQITALGGRIWTGLALVALTAVLARRRQFGSAAALVLGFAAALALGWWLRATAFEPFGMYPSGHALRTAYMALAVTWIVRNRVLTVVAWAIVAAVAIASIRQRSHYTEEILGGLLLGWSAAALALAVGRRGHDAAQPGRDGEASDHPAQPGALA